MFLIFLLLITLICAVPIDPADLSALQTALADMRCVQFDCALYGINAGYDCSTTLIDDYVFCDNSGRILSIHLDNQKLTAPLSPSLGKLSEMTRLRINQNVQRGGMGGTIPTELLSLNLTILQLAKNKIGGIVPKFGESLIELNLEENDFTGTIPPLPSNLAVFSIAETEIVAPLPPLPESLISIDFSGIDLGGTLPSLPSNLEILIANQAQLSGTIPALPPSIKKIVLNRNVLSGTLPALPKGIVVLNLANNQLTGLVPNGTIDRTAAHNCRLYAATNDGNCFQQCDPVCDCARGIACITPTEPPPTTLPPSTSSTASIITTNNAPSSPSTASISTVSRSPTASTSSLSSVLTTNAEPSGSSTLITDDTSTDANATPVITNSVDIDTNTHSNTIFVSIDSFGSTLSSTLPASSSSLSTSSTLSSSSSINTETFTTTTTSTSSDTLGNTEPIDDGLSTLATALIVIACILCLLCCGIVLVAVVLLRRQDDDDDVIVVVEEDARESNNMSEFATSPLAGSEYMSTQSVLNHSQPNANYTMDIQESKWDLAARVGDKNKASGKPSTLEADDQVYGNPLNVSSQSARSSTGEEDGVYGTGQVYSQY